MNILFKLDRVFERLIIVFLFGLFRIDFLVREMLVVIFVIDILRIGI